MATKKQAKAAPVKTTKKRKAESEVESSAHDVPTFDFATDFADQIDKIEKHHGLETSSIEDTEPMSTGMLSHDLMLGGGIRPCWYTSLGAEQSAKTTTVLTIMASAVKHAIGLIHHSDYEGSTASAGPYLRSIFKGAGLSLSVPQIFGKKDAKGGWEIKPRVRYRASSALEDFFDYMHAVLSEMPDKRKISGKWWLVYEDTKANKAKFSQYSDSDMGKRYGKGIYVPAKDGNLQAIFFVDSYPAMLPAEQDKEEANNSLALQARAFSKHLPRVKGRMAKKMVAVIGINQLRDVPMAMYGPKESEPGGNALKLYSDARMQHTKRSLSAAPFKAIAGKDYNEAEPSVQVKGGFDRYFYVHLKMKKNKISNPGRQSFMRVWVEDATGEARGLDPVFDTIYYLKMTGQISGGQMKGGQRKGFKLNLHGLGPAKHEATWHQIKQWILGEKKTKEGASQYFGYKPMDLRAFCFKQMRTGVSDALYTETKNAIKAEGSESEDGDGDDGDEE